MGATSLGRELGGHRVKAPDAVEQFRAARDDGMGDHVPAALLQDFGYARDHQMATQRDEARGARVDIRKKYYS